ncbi:HSP20 family protein [Rubrivivax sp. A210]|uniref:Hsp20/alpha crystallin family protein n=1 Tax=Rubrivivax sp. A210 TaxID=2772301 RepID=UPI00191A6C60|nr:Hsp20/alpha crystallin family protein [Rubrivivax sp. A210]CAD5373130.1 HSP20 family protein [Rubrivivax sp. A210]
MYGSLLSYPNSLFSQFERLRDGLDEIFANPGVPSSIRSVAPGTLPAINIGRTANSVEIYAFAPGLDADKIDVTVDRGVLHISGERASGVPEGSAKVYARERGAGRFARAVALPDDVDPAKVSASYRDGVLQVSIARRESAQPKRVIVQ